MEALLHAARSSPFPHHPGTKKLRTASGRAGTTTWREQSVAHSGGAPLIEFGLPTAGASTLALAKNPTMPLKLSKEEVASLSQEQLDAYARVHLDSERTRRDLCDKASGRNHSILLPIMAGVLGTVAIVSFPGLFFNPVTLVVLALALLFVFHWRTNRRIDALVRLLNLDHLAENKSAEPDMDNKPH